MRKKELKFKKGDIVKFKNLSNLCHELEKCGIYHPEKLIEHKGEIIDIDFIDIDNSDDLPYYVRFDNEEKDCYYLPEDLLELATAEKLVATVANVKKIKIKYHEPITPLENINGANSDWIDLRCAEPNGVDLKTGEFKLISLGVSMKLPDGYEAHIAPRSSTFKNWGILEVNSVGVVDSSFCSNEDIWKFPAYATRDTHIDFNDRICQFRIVKKQPTIIFEKVDHLDGKSRGGFGSSGIK